MRRLAFLPILFLALALAACGLGRSEFEDDPAYKAGHSDGCWSATSEVPGDPSTITRDDEAWKESEAYRAGWKAGYSACTIRGRSGSMGMPDLPERGTGVH